MRISDIFRYQCFVFCLKTVHGTLVPKHAVRYRCIMFCLKTVHGTLVPKHAGEAPLIFVLIKTLQQLVPYTVYFDTAINFTMHWFLRSATLWVATGYGLDGPGDRTPVWARFSLRSTPAPRPISLLRVFPWGKAVGVSC
jgi:hypothetical protein